MKIAYYINNNGEKLELAANDNNCRRYTGRLTCPNCGEQVDWVNGKVQEKHFRHHHGSYMEICENYCKSLSTIRYIQPYERAGLPLYLIKEFGKFTLSIGFYGLDETTIDEAENLNLEIEIELDKNNKVSRKINNQYFAPCKMNFIKINTVREQYKLKFSKNIIPSEIKKKWTSNINGIGINGAIFYFGDFGGKKVSSSSGLRVNEEYLLFTSNNMNNKKTQGLSLDQIQEINFGWLSNYKIYKLIITEINRDTIEFCDKYDMKLQYVQPEVIPLWPPCATLEQELIYADNCDKYFILNTDNSEGKDVYSHTIKLKLPSENIENKKYLTKSSIKSDDFISIGNLQNPFIFSVTKKRVLRDIIVPEIHIEAKAEKMIINTNTKIFINYFKNGMLLKSEIIKKELIGDLESKRNEEIDVLYGLDIIWSKSEKLKWDIVNDYKILDKELLDKIRKCSGQFVAVPANFKWMVLKHKKLQQSYKLLITLMKEDKISVELINLLKTFI